MGGKQLGFADYEQTVSEQRTKKEKFLAEMDQLVPWQPLLDLIEPVYPKVRSKGGRPPYPLASMLRIHLMPPVSAKKSARIKETTRGCNR